jgi:transcriptional regulator of acetoin/glycerol metabolism
VLGVPESVESGTAQIEAIATPQADTDEYAPVSDEVRLDIEVAARSDLMVLISGGDALTRELLARRIHRRGDGGDRPLIVVERTFIQFFGAIRTEARRRSKAGFLEPIRVMCRRRSRPRAPHC